MEEQIKMPIEALNDEILEEVSGGVNFQEGVNVGLDAYSKFSTLTSLTIAPFTDSINEAADKLRYKDVIKVIKSYDDSLEQDEDIWAAFATSWNSKHPKGGEMNAAIASYILALKDYPITRAKITSMTKIKDIVAALDEIYE
ncbi:MAG: hypothetical protein Q4D57_00590 [Clostridia bacterium]|nr:hypothetical protein [Clostridia bacterium]